MSQIELPEHLGGHSGRTHVDEGALRWLQAHGCRTLLDVGCGPGGQVQLARQVGMDAVGIDGDPSCNPTYLHDFTKGMFVPPDVLGFRFDALWCVEFLEHVEARYLTNVQKTIAMAAPRFAVIAAAPPGKRGHHHVNCQPADYWIARFEECGMTYHVGHTEALRKASTMVREFVPKRGLVFVRA